MSNPTTSSLPSRHRPRSSSLSLSIARSPSVLSSGLFFTPPNLNLNPTSTSDHIGNELEDEIHNHPNLYNTHPYSNPIRRVISAGGVLDPINGSDEDLNEMNASSSTPQLNLHNGGRLKSNSISFINNNKNKDNDDNEEEEEENEIGNGNDQKPLLSRKVTFPPTLPHTNSITLSRTSTRNTNNTDLEMDSAAEISYQGPFQPPDSKELLSIILSVIGVMILAVAAGCTTIFDWVL